MWGADSADMQLISKFNKEIRLDIFSKYAWVILLKNKKGLTLTNPFQKILDESIHRKAKSKGCKPNKIWVDKGSEFYCRSMKSWLEKSAVEMYSTHNERQLLML